MAARPIPKGAGTLLWSLWQPRWQPVRQEIHQEIASYDVREAHSGGRTTSPNTPLDIIRKKLEPLVRQVIRDFGEQADPGPELQAFLREDAEWVMSVVIEHAIGHHRTEIIKREQQRQLGQPTDAEWLAAHLGTIASAGLRELSELPRLQRPASFWRTA